MPSVAAVSGLERAIAVEGCCCVGSGVVVCEACVCVACVLVFRASGGRNHLARGSQRSLHLATPRGALQGARVSQYSPIIAPLVPISATQAPIAGTHLQVAVDEIEFV